MNHFVFEVGHALANSNFGLEPKLVTIALSLAAATFVLDLLQPLGVAAGIPYVAVVLVGLWSRVGAFVYLLAGLASILTILGVFASSGDQGSWIVFQNRALALFAIWAVALAGARRVSDLEHVDEALRESEARLRATMEGSLDGVYFHKAIRNAENEIVDFEFVDVSERGIDMLPLGRDELIGTRLSETYPGAFENGLFDKLKTVLETGAPLDEEMRAFTNVDAQWLHHQIVAYGDGVAFTVRDITEAKESEESLRQSEASLENAQRIAHLGNWDWDVATNTGHWSDQLYRIFGMPPQETEADFDLFMELVHPGDRDLIAKAVEDALSGERPYRLDHRLIRRDGEVRFLKEIAEVRRDGNGTPISMHGTVQDITELKDAEQALRESERRLQRAHRIAKLSHWDIDIATQRFKAYGDMYADFDLGGKETEFSFEDALQPVHPDDVARIRAAFERSFAEGVPFDETDRVVYDDGRTGHMRLIGEVIRDPTGSVVGMRGTTQDVTEHMQAQESLKRQEAQLRESEQRLQEAHRIASLTHWEFDVSANCFSAFGEVIDDLEPSAESGKFTGKEAFGLIFPEDAQRVGRAFERARSDGTPYNETYRVRDTDGTIIHLHSLGEAVCDETGSVVAIRGTSQDVTAAVEAEAELRESQRRLLDAQRTANLGNWVFDVATGQYSALGEFFEQYDFPMDDEQAAFSLEEGLAVVHPDDLEIFKSCLDKCLIDGTTFDVTVRSLTADGQIFYLHVIGEAIRDAAGSVVEIQGTTQDVTAQKTVEDELRISQAGLENAQRIARMGNWDWNIETGELRWSDEIYRIFGQTPQSFGATYDAFIDIVHPDDREMVRDGVDAAVQGGAAYNIVHRIVLPDGQIRTVHEEGEVTLAEDGTPRRMTGIVQDVTEQVQMEDQLRHAQKMETVGQLSAGVAHDFNNMLSVIMGNLELAQRRIDSDPQVESLLESALKASQRGAELTHSLLAFSRKQVLFPKPVNVNEAVASVLELASRTVAKMVTVKLEPLADLWAANVDPAHLESAVLNLVVNACSAMPDGGELKITTWNASQLSPNANDEKTWPTADYVCLAVADTGHGMTPEVLEKAVEPFFTTKGMAQGSGLGLSMVYGFVEQSGGLFDIVSEPGVGTKVTLSLLRADPALPLKDQPKSAGRRDENAKTVLLVEDEPQVMETVAFQLSDLGFRVLVAPDAEQALRLLGQNVGVDLLFADVVLGPGKNGIDLALEAKQKYPNLKVLCTSGYAGEELLARYEGARDLQILSKPFTLDKLSERLDEVLRIDA